jgi:RNA polymerase sigma factor (sigma-70 family)
MQNFNLDLNILKPIFDFELFKVRQQDKDDVKQTAILRILESLKNYTSEELPENKLFSFAQVIVKRTVVDYYRKSGRKIEQNTTSVFFADGQAGSDSDMGEATDEKSFATSADDVNYEVADIRTDYENNSHKFTPQERKIIDYLLFNENGSGMNMAEISAELGINKSHATRALKKLREVCADRY